MTDTLENRSGISANVLKYIAIAAMLIDHLGWAFVPTNSALGQATHFIGRFTAPIMCYFVAEGYHYTRNIKKYLLRLGIFAVISHIPFLMTGGMDAFPVEIRNGSLWINPDIFTTQTSVFYTLFLALLAVFLWDKVKNVPLRLLIIVIICALALIGDWIFFAVLWALTFYIYRGDKKRQFAAYYIIAGTEILSIVIMRIVNDSFNPLNLIWQLGLLVPPLFLSLYNGKRGSTCKFNKWFFYVFYPAHLLVIGTILIILKEKL